MTLLLDTAVWINLVTQPEAVPARIRRQIQAADTVGLCSVSLLEASILDRCGRLGFTAPFADFLALALTEEITLLDLTPAVALAERSLKPEFHPDPFDRTITATAKTLGLPLVTPDPRIRDAEECAVEFYHYRTRR